MRCLKRIMFTGSIFLVMVEGFSNGSSAAMAQQHWIACAAARTSPNGAQIEQAIVAKKEDALVLADLKEEAVLLPSLVDEYAQKVKRAQLEASAAWELFARELEKRVLHVTGEAELRTSIERLIRCSDGLERDTQAAKLGSLSELRLSRSQWNHEQYFVALAALVPLFKQDIERRPKRLEIWMSRAFAPSERFLPHRMRMNPYSWEGIVLAGIDSYQDERAARFLLDYALRPSKANAVDTMAQWALVFLRAYHPAVVKPAIAAALEEEKRKGGDWEWSPSFLTRPSRAFLLQDCLASLEIAESLPPEELVAYQYFQRSAWQIYALRPCEGQPVFIHPAPTAWNSHYYHLNHAKYGYPPVPDWQDGNEQFLLALLGKGVRQMPVISDKISEEGSAVLYREISSGTLPPEAKERLAAMLSPNRAGGIWASREYRNRGEAPAFGWENSAPMVTAADQLLAYVTQIEQKALSIPISNGLRSYWLMVGESELLEEVVSAGREREVLEELMRLRLTQRPAEPSKDARSVRCLDGLARLILRKNAPELRKAAQGIRGDTAYGVNEQWQLGLAIRNERDLEDCNARALLAIDSYADQRARDFLLEFASRDELDDRTKAQIWQLLLHYDGARCLVPQLEKAFKRPVKGYASRSFGFEFSGLDVSPPSLSSWVRELDYIESLDAAARDRYLQIRRRVFVADALAPRMARPAPAAHPSLLTYGWQDGDERFLPHLLETGRPFAIVIVEAPISEAGLAWLKEQVESGSWSDDVKAQIRGALAEREKRTKQQGQDLNR